MSEALRPAVLVLALLTAEAMLPAFPDPPAQSGPVFALTLPECVALDAEYRVALQEAIRCNPAVRHGECRVRVASRLICPCPILAEDFNRVALETMDAAAALFGAGGCSSQFECGAGLCPIPSSAVCLAQNGGAPPGPTKGVCVGRF